MLTTRRAAIDDSNLIMRHRKSMFADMRNAEETVLEEMGRNFEPWVRRMIAEEKYVGWVTSDGERVVGSAGLLILDWAPHFLDPRCDRRGYILNVFVEPEYRGRGIAKALTLECMAETKRRGIGVVALHASQKGQPVYERLGFTTSNEMLFVTSSDLRR
ncbi:MAG TPA: GNAT family N-acetyltransferase [Terracidiphilus sp.]|nr:GNAT family N-acetyltransferase [Terracidiphilus sp.]